MLKARYSVIALSLFAVIASSATSAQDSVREGGLCLSGICIGDELAQLPPVVWGTGSQLSSTPLKPLDSYDARKIQRKFIESSASAVLPLTPNFFWGSFDSVSLPLLAELTGFCEPTRALVGKFTSESGHPTFITLDALPGANPSKPTFRVTKIRREFPREYTQGQIADLKKQLTVRFKGFEEASEYGSYPTPTWNLDVQFRNLTMKGPEPDMKKLRDQFLRYPGCGKALSID